MSPEDIFNILIESLRWNRNHTKTLLNTHKTKTKIKKSKKEIKQNLVVMDLLWLLLLRSFLFFSFIVAIGIMSSVL